MEAFGQATRSALVPVRLVDGAAALQFARRLARVDPVPVDAALEEATAACGENSRRGYLQSSVQREPRLTVATVDSVVLAGAAVPTHLAGDVQKTVSWRRTGETDADKWLFEGRDSELCFLLPSPGTPFHPSFRG